MAARICKNCGANYQPLDGYCKNCGARYPRLRAFEITVRALLIVLAVVQLSLGMYCAFVSMKYANAPVFVMNVKGAPVNTQHILFHQKMDQFMSLIYFGLVFVSIYLCGRIQKSEKTPKLFMPYVIVSGVLPVLYTVVSSLVITMYKYGLLQVATGKDTIAGTFGEIGDCFGALFSSIGKMFGGDINTGKLFASFGNNLLKFTQLEITSIVVLVFSAAVLVVGILFFKKRKSLPPLPWKTEY